jgi:hypothetical protein
LLLAAESCLERIRFKLVFGKQRAKVLYAPGGSQSDKDKVWGQYSYKFQIIVKVRTRLLHMQYQHEGQKLAQPQQQLAATAAGSVHSSSQPQQQSFAPIPELQQ